MLKLLETIKTSRQVIRIYEAEDGNQILTLNTFAQFKEGQDESIYHKTITDEAFKLNPNAQRILILGGGDGLVARNVRRINPEAQIILVDYDKILVEFFSTRSRFVELNENSLHFCTKYYVDARLWIKDWKEKFDIIILDLPDPTNLDLKKLYQEGFYRNVCKLLTSKGVISIQVRLDLRWEVARYIQKILKNYTIKIYEMQWMGEGSIILGQNVKL
jgi:spermidine synthase